MANMRCCMLLQAWELLHCKPHQYALYKHLCQNIIMVFSSTAFTRLCVWTRSTTKKKGRITDRYDMNREMWMYVSHGDSAEPVWLFFMCLHAGVPGCECERVGLGGGVATCDILERRNYSFVPTVVGCSITEPVDRLSLQLHVLWKKTLAEPSALWHFIIIFFKRDHEGIGTCDISVMKQSGTNLSAADHPARCWTP